MRKLHILMFIFMVTGCAHVSTSHENVAKAYYSGPIVSKQSESSYVEVARCLGSTLDFVYEGWLFPVHILPSDAREKSYSYTPFPGGLSVYQTFWATSLIDAMNTPAVQQLAVNKFPAGKSGKPFRPESLFVNNGNPVLIAVETTQYDRATIDEAMEVAGRIGPARVNFGGSNSWDILTIDMRWRYFTRYFWQGATSAAVFVPVDDRGGEIVVAENFQGGSIEADKGTRAGQHLGQRMAFERAFLSTLADVGGMSIEDCVIDRARWLTDVRRYGSEYKAFSVSERVRHTQVMLRVLGHYYGLIDGQWDQETISAMDQYLRTKGITRPVVLQMMYFIRLRRDTAGHFIR